MRLDKYLVENNLAKSRAEAVYFVTSGAVDINGKAVEKAKVEVKADDTVTVRDISYPDHEKFDPQVLYEDDDYLVVDKPIGMLTHAKGGYLPEQTLATWFAEREGWLEELIPGVNARRGIVHRLDRTTSGLIAMAKNDQAEKSLAKQFADRKIVKEYVALTSDKPSQDEAIIDVPLGRNPNDPKCFRPDAEGKPSVTYYKVLGEFNIDSKTVYRIQLLPKTGRTHQLRVHLAHIGTPILGDTIYGGKKSDRVYLHSQMMEFADMSGKAVAVVSEPSF